MQLACSTIRPDLGVSTLIARYKQLSFFQWFIIHWFIVTTLLGVILLIIKSGIYSEIIRCLVEIFNRYFNLIR